MYRRSMMRLLSCFICLASLLAAAVNVSAQESPARVTILYDAFGKVPGVKHGWGYSALVEYGGKRILFDTGGHQDDFAANAKTLGVDLSRLDFVVITHRHGDHTSGLRHVLTLNPGVQIYAPVENGYNTPMPPGLAKMVRRRVDSAPDDMHYFDGKYPEPMTTGSIWHGAKFTHIRTPIEVLPGFWLFSMVSDATGTKELNEVSMAIRTPQGLVVMVGCSHPGIEKILEAAAKIDPRVYSVFGGFHLVDLADTEVTAIVTRFRDKWKFERVAAGHCTGEFAFSEFNRVYGPKFDHASVGSVIALPR